MNRTLFFALTLALATSVLAGVETEPLYRFKSNRGNFLFTSSPSLPKVSDQWTREAVACHVPTASANMRPIYSLVKSDDLGVRYAYTKSATEGGGGWQRQEAVAFYVAPEKLPGTTALYRLYAPLRTNGDPDGFSGPVAGTDTHYYTADPTDKKQAVAAGWVSQGILGYVWTSPLVLPDLTVQKTDASDFSVTVHVRNAGKKNVSGSLYQAVLSIYRPDGSLVTELTEQGTGVSPSQVRPLVFNTGKTTLARMRYRVTLDPAGAVDESDESNNATPMTDGPKRLMVINNSHAPTGPPRPSIFVTDVKPMANGRVRYSVKVTNVDAYDAKWFVPAGPALDGTCGDGRMTAVIFVTHEGTRKKMSCQALVPRSALNVVDFVSSSALDDGDAIQLALVDHLLDAEYLSDAFKPGWIGVAPLLGSAGCKPFLGRVSHYLCNAEGFKACEGLRKSGKPIQCTQQGKKN